MKENKGIKLCVIALAFLIVLSMLASSAMAVTRQDLCTKFLAQKEIEDLKNNMSYEITAVPNEKSGIDVKVGMGTESYENTFVFDGSTCKITLKGASDELGKKLLKNMWAACAEIGNENGVRIDAITGETGDNAVETFWKKFTEKVDKGEDNYVAYGVKIEKDANDSYIGTINTQMYKVDLSDLNSISYDSTNKASNNVTNNTTNKVANTAVKEFTSNVTRIPNAGNNQGVINFFRIIAFVAVAVIVAFSIYNVKSKK